MAVSILETIKSKANAGNTAYIVVLSLLCDTYSELPTKYGLTGYELAQGCKAHVIDTNMDYMLDSVGTWHIYGGGIWQNVYTKTETDALLDDKQDELTATQLNAINSGITAEKLTEIFDDQQRQKIKIDYALNTGAVNILANTAATTTAANGLTYTVNADKSVTVTGNASAYYAFTIAGSRTYANAMPLKRGTYIIKAGIAYDSRKPIYVQFGIMASSGASISWQNIYNVNKELVVNNDTTRIVYELYNPSGNFSGYNATFYPMILDKSLYDAGFTEYQPYAPTNRELYEMILALK